MQRLRKLFAVFLSLVLMTVYSPRIQVSAETSSTLLTFSETGIEETKPGSGYAISGTSLVISSPGVYKVTGSCSEGSIEIAKGAENVFLIIEDLNLASSVTAPLIIKKSAKPVIHLNGVSTLTNNEDPANETSSDTTIADAFEGAAIKAKSSASVTFCGEGTLNVFGNTKNGIKGGAETQLIFNSGTFNIECINNGIASDGSIVFNGGTYTINSDNDGIKSVPDVEDTASVGSLLINGGSFTINANGDGIQAETELTINNGTFNITTMGGYNDSTFNKDTMSCKGLKASGDREDITNILNILGGTFTLNTVDDAIHSDADISISGGTFIIQTGDDGVHADGMLKLGIEEGFERDPDITILNSYEGLEGLKISILSGRYYVTATDDGINAAGGASSGTEPDPWNPWGGGSSSSADCNIYIYGGDIYVDCQGDGLDSNGSLYLYGGRQTVLSMGRNGDNSPLDADGTIELKGAEVFGAGSRGMGVKIASGSQNYYAAQTSYNANAVVSVISGGTRIYNEKLVRAVNYEIYSSPSLGSNRNFSNNYQLDPCLSNDWTHSWDNGIVVTEPSEENTGIMLYTCQICGKEEKQTIPCILSITCDGHEEEIIEEDKGYPVKFIPDDHSTVNVYYTQDYTEPNEISVSETVSRNSDTGYPDSSGEGQVNFAVVVEDGYEIDDVTVEGSYKNFKIISVDGNTTIYRVTKVASALTITVSTIEKTADVPYVCYLGNTLELSGLIIVDFYLEVPDEYSDAEVVMTLNGRPTRVNVQGGILDTNNIRYYSCPALSTEMRDPITIYVERNGEKVPMKTSSGTDYTNGYEYTILKSLDNYRNSSDEKLVKLANAMDAFGQYVQILVKHNEEGLTPPQLDEVPMEDLDTYASTRDADLETLKYAGARLELNSDTTIWLYYQPAEGHTLNEYTFTVDNKTAVVEESGGYYILKIRNIKSNELGHMYSIKVTDGTNTQTLNYSALSYAQSIITKNSDVNNVNACKAVYWYYKAAYAYANATH